jgi:hypothetical protein
MLMSKPVARANGFSKAVYANCHGTQDWGRPFVWHAALVA